MSAVARTIRPFASRALAQKPLAPMCRAAPAFRFPRGTRSFTQSPLELNGASSCRYIADDVIDVALAKKYTESHEWVELVDGKIAKVGITEYAAHALGDVVFVELPEEGLAVSSGEPVGAVESVKSASDGNAVLEDNAKTINSSPEGEGWIAEIEVNDVAELDALLDEAAYKATLDE
ncbi:hypothetical protein N7468_007447 [Penicillium chermesinum]|uniref:Glycine cleavage system H protein n=1 Tax=Penicillium chermesinum TaxID=63820 RepID=A0A9W9NUC4_9EURO|nr:uncharacterized protein N7468_007447 [Penicillium chermesinum]KAJ5226222.1 hypothetical protein N7468_007447 [Penicillium chermesinum]